MGVLTNVEVELTFPLLNQEALKRRLAELARPEKQQEYQKDTYYIPAHRNFLKQKPISEWLRVRETQKGASLNYKFWHNQDDAQAVSADELETEVSDVGAVKNILRRLDIKEVVIVEKRRSTWMYKDVEIAIDEVTDLGSHIELEAKGEFASVEEAKKRLYVVLKEIGAKTGLQDFRGYPHLLLEKQGLLKN
ncbi:MAG: class IV adenylate cyclase [Candidatus Kerfeldbacteria bacterium]|nr:class IV adenylate cyclase [Candidatus Kerfeldbacteria bacterium]